MTKRSSYTASKNIIDMLGTIQKRVKVEKGSYLYQEGTLANELYIVLSGKIQIGKITSDGRELTFRICKEDDIVGELTLFSSPAKYMLNAKVIESGEVGILLKDDIESRLAENNKLALEFMKWMSDNFRRTQTKFRDLVLHGKKGALYSTLIRLTNSYGIYKEDGIHISLTLTNQELANFCGTSREVVNRMLSDLRKNDIISIDKGKIIVHNIQFLRNGIECENCPIELCKID